MAAKDNFASGCEGKAAYNNRPLAEKVAAAMNRPNRAGNRKKTGHAPARVYKCECCGWWHITGSKTLKK